MSDIDSRLPHGLNSWHIPQALGASQRLWCLGDAVLGRLGKEMLAEVDLIKV